MKRQIAYFKNGGALFVMTNDKGEVFYIPDGTGIKLPFVTEEKYQLVDAAALSNITAKYLLAEMQIKNLKKQVEDNYSSKYLEKYFREKIVDLPNLDVVNKIVTKYSDFLELTFDNATDWSKKRAEINSQNISHVEKDIANMNLFMEFLKS